MASQLPEEPVELATLRKRLKFTVGYRDKLATHLAEVEAEIAADARAFATLNGDFVRPTLEQLRRMLFDENGKG